MPRFEGGYRLHQTMGNSVTRVMAARAAIVAILAASTLAYGSLEKQVTVRIEGRPVAVRTHAATVADALERAGIDVGPQDRVLPSLGAPVRDGGIIEVRRAKPVTLLLNGKTKRVVVTALTIDEVLEEINVRDRLLDSVHPARDTRVSAGMTITYRAAVALTVVHDDEREEVVTNASSVGAVVRELGIRLGKRDYVQPSAALAPTQGMTIRVLRVGVRREAKTYRVAYETILRRTAKLEYGMRRVSQPGREGLRRVVYRAKYVDGKRVARTTVSVRWVRRPSPRIILIGSGFPGCACSRGTQLGKATWYSQADGLTAAHRTLPMGTTVRVENRANGRAVNVVIRDRGPYGDGRIIDLSDEAFRKIASLGEGVIDVRIRW